MTVYITLTTAGTDSGPFNLYSNLDGFVTPFETGVSKSALLAGYTSTLVPNYTAIVRVKSTGVCINYVDIPVDGAITTTTTTSSTTTTTTTTIAPLCLQYTLSVSNVSGESADVTYLNCDGIEQFQTVYWGSSIAFCATEIISENLGPFGSLSLIGSC